MPAKILAFAGSARRESFNKKLVAIAAEGARSAGGDVTLIDLADYELPLFNQDDEEANGPPENAVRLKRLFADSDGLLIASPEYNSTLTALLKNTIEWVSRPTDAEPRFAFRGKTAAVLSASPGGVGGMRGLVHLRAILGNVGATVVPDTVSISQAHEAFADNGALRDDRKQQQALGVGAALAQAAAKLSGK